MCVSVLELHTLRKAQGTRGRTDGQRPRPRPVAGGGGIGPARQRATDCCRIWIVWRHARSSFQMRQDQSLGEAARSCPPPPIVSGDRQTATAASDCGAGGPRFRGEGADKTTIFVSLLTPSYEVHWKMFPCERDRFVGGASTETALDLPILSLSPSSDTAVINLPPTADFTAAAAARRAAGSSIFSAFFMGGKKRRNAKGI